jgi:4-hydroxythreonine-4-phosphate dehydrogenase
VTKHPSSWPTLAITTGEPSGIGVEVSLKALKQDYPAKILLLGDLHHIATINQQSRLNLRIHRLTSLTECPPHQAGEVYVWPIELAADVQLGKPKAANAGYVLQLLNQAHQWAMDGLVDALVTAPLHKSVINQAGVPFSGHTEFFAERSGVEQVVMMLASEVMRVALVTTHLPLSKVASRVTTERLHRVLATAITGLHRLGMTHPSIKVCGLNPHAGEQGHLGNEEQDIIIPALSSFATHYAELAAQCQIAGPYPADTIFSKHHLATTDLFLGMYHDQVLPVIKYASFGACANVTLGLPYLRTSVDHGTGLDIAAQFIADSGSMEYAIQFALNALTMKQQSPL